MTSRLVHLPGSAQVHFRRHRRPWRQGPLTSRLVILDQAGRGSAEERARGAPPEASAAAPYRQGRCHGLLHAGRAAAAQAPRPDADSTIRALPGEALKSDLFAKRLAEIAESDRWAASRVSSRAQAGRIMRRRLRYTPKLGVDAAARNRDLPVSECIRSVHTGPDFGNRHRQVVQPDERLRVLLPDDGSTEVFVHHSDIVSDEEWRNLMARDVVEFDLQHGPKGPLALNVRPRS